MRDDDFTFDLTHVRSSLPLHDTQFAAVRRAVMTKIRHRDRSPLALRLGFAFGALVLALTAFLNRPVPLPFAPPQQPTVALVAPKPPLPDVTSSGERASRPQRPAVSAGRYRHPKGRPAPPARTAALHATHIQLQTADPDVRIIWIIQ